MHTCVRCGREATSLEEIHNGCPCGAKVFVFNKDAEKETQSQPQASSPQTPQENSGVKSAGDGPQAGEIVFPQQDGNKQENGKKADGKEGDAAEGKAPESSFARTTFSTEDVENIKIVSEGVFFVDVNALSKNPVVLKDEEGVYYVRLPLSQNVIDEENGNGKSGSNGKAAIAEEKKAVEPKAK